MNLKIDPDDYKKLIELVYLGEWMINAHHDTDAQDDSAGRVLQQLLRAELSEDIGQDPETNEYFIQSEWTEKIYDDYILDYDDHVFWDELIERLAQRDLARQKGVHADDIIRDDDLLELRPLEERYRSEVEDNGLERLELRDF